MAILQAMSISPRYYPLSIIRALWKRKWFILGLAMLGSGGTVAVVSRLSPVYSAKAVILVESQKIPENFVASTVQTSLEAQLDTLKQQVLSRDRLWKLLEEFDLYREERVRSTKEEVLERMRRDLNISLLRNWSARGPGAFQVEYQTGKPDVAAEIANRIGLFFINENQRQRTEEAEATSAFLDGQLAASETRLQQQEAKLKEFKLTHNGELPEQQAALLAAVNQSHTELLALQEGLGRAQQNKLILESSLEYAQSNLRLRTTAQRQDAEQRHAALRAGVPREPAAGVPATLTPLEQAQSELVRLRARYMDSHPEVQRMIREVERLKGVDEALAISRVPAATLNPAATNQAGVTPSAATEELQTEQNRIQELGAQIAIVNRDIRSLEERRQKIIQDVAEAQARIRSLPVREQQLAVITRDYDTSRANYQSLLNKKLAADVATDMERWHKSQKFVMLDPARVPQKPARPHRILLDTSGSLAALIFSAALAFVLELRKNAFLGEWELPPDVCIIGRVPRMHIAQS